MQYSAEPEIQVNVSSVSHNQPANDSEMREQKFKQLKISRNRGYQIVPFRAIDMSDPPPENDSAQGNLSISVSCLATPKAATQSSKTFQCCAVLKLLTRCFIRSSSNEVRQVPGSKYIIKDKESDNTH